MPAHRFDPIDTRQCVWLGRGELRDIYQHPDLPDALIKVIRADRVDAEGNVVSWARKKPFAGRRFGLYVTFLREFRETLRAAHRLYAHPEVPLPFARPLGLAATERGFGLVVEKIGGPDGALAPSLKHLNKTGALTPAHEEALSRFFAVCARHHIVFGDLNPGNLVFAPARGFVCVDGIGEKTLIPVHEMSRWLNARKLRRMENRLRAGIEKARRARSSAPLPVPSV